MLEVVPIRVKGRVQIYSIKGEQKELLIEKDNALEPDYQSIIVNSMAGVPLSNLDYISVWDGLTLKGIKNPLTLVASSPVGGPFALECQALFPIGSSHAGSPDEIFDGNFDNLKLGNLSLGGFSSFQMTVSSVPLTITKSPLEQILIIWKLKFL